NGQEIQMDATTTKIEDFTAVTIELDASFDLHAAGEENDEAARADFTNAYTQCAEFIAEKSGVRIEVIAVNAVSPGFSENRLEKEFGDDLWQDIHDCLDREDGEW